MDELRKKILEVKKKVMRKALEYIGTVRVPALSASEVKALIDNNVDIGELVLDVNNDASRSLSRTVELTVSGINADGTVDVYVRVDTDEMTRIIRRAFAQNLRRYDI